MIYLYILQLRDSRYYCGITNNLERRFAEHSTTRKSWASRVGVLKIVHTEILSTRKLAAKKERKIKTFGVKKYFQYFRLFNKTKF